ALPAGVLTPQMLTLPPAPLDEQRQIVRGELARFVPVQLDASFSWMPMAPGGGAGGNTLAFLAEGDAMAAFQQAFAMANIEVDAGEPDAIAALRAAGSGAGYRAERSGLPDGCTGLPQQGAVAAVFVSESCSEMAFPA